MTVSCLHANGKAEFSFPKPVFSDLKMYLRVDKRPNWTEKATFLKIPAYVWKRTWTVTKTDLFFFCCFLRCFVFSYLFFLSITEAGLTQDVFFFTKLRLFFLSIRTAAVVGPLQCEVGPSLVETWLTQRPRCHPSALQRRCPFFY